MVGLLTAVTSARVGAVESVVVVLSVVVVVSPADESAAATSSFVASPPQAAKRNRNSRMDSGKRPERFSFLTLPGSKEDDGSIVPLARFMTQVFTWTYLKLTFPGHST